MSTTRLIAIAFATLLPAAGCLKNRPAGPSYAAPVRATLAADALFEGEIGGANVMTAYEAVARLRPGMLVRRPGIRENRGVDVYVDGLLLGGADQLSAIPASHVHEIRFVRSADAPSRYPHVASSGLILVTTKLGPRGTKVGN